MKDQNCQDDDPERRDYDAHSTTGENRCGIRYTATKCEIVWSFIMFYPLHDPLRKCYMSRYHYTGQHLKAEG